MNDNRSLARDSAIVLSVMSLFVSMAIAQTPTFTKEWGTPLSDPLLSRPPVLQTGVTLPGDTRSINDVCSSNTTGTLALNLAEAVDLALCHNPQIKSAWATTKVQAAAVGEARAAYLPSLTIGGARVSSRTDYLGSPFDSQLLKNTTLNAGMTWRLFDFGGRNANQRATQALLAAALASHDAILQKTLASVVTAFFDVQTTQANWQSRQINEELTRQILDTAQRRENRGVGARTDTLQAVTALAKVRLEKSRAQGAFHRASAVLIYTLGSPSGTELRLIDRGADENQVMHQELNAWLEQAQLTHPAIVAARAQLQAAQEKITVTRSEGLPTIDFSSNFYQNGRPNQGLSATKTHETVLGISVSIPLFDGFARTYKVRGAQAQVEQKEAELQDTEHQILMDVVKTHADVNAALDNLQASQSLLTAAQDALNSVQRKFDKGIVDIVETLNAQAALSDAQQEQIRCQAEWRSARLLLIANSGLLGRNTIHYSP